MFTGIVEKTVKVLGVSSGPMFRRLVLQSDWDDIKNGDSVAVNGCCLTVADRGRNQIGFDVIAETLDKTNLGLLKAGDEVNVERSLLIGQRIDGHFVQGHIDGTAPLVEAISNENEVRLVIQKPPHLAKYIVPKGSVSIDGVSLTVAAIGPQTFEVALIPTTLKLTQLGTRPENWPFNLETDVISKTIVNYLELMGVAAPGPR